MNVLKNKKVVLILFSVFLLSTPFTIFAFDVCTKNINGLNRICKKEGSTCTNTCTYYCSKRRLAAPDGMNCGVAKGTISNACYAGISRILYYVDNSDWNSVSKTEDMVNLMLYKYCKGDGTSSSYTNTSPRSDYRYSQTIWDSAKSAYATVKEIGKQKVTFSTNKINFNKNADANLKVTYNKIVGGQDMLYKAECTVTNNGKIATKSSGWKEKLTGISSGATIYVKANKPNENITLKCKLHYQFSKPIYYSCGNNYQDFVGKGTENVDVYSPESSVSGKHAVTQSEKIVVKKTGTVKKADGSVEKTENLGGVKFTLYDSNCKKSIKSVTTNAKGVATFTFSDVTKDTTYCLREIKTVSGYNVKPESVTGDGIIDRKTDGNGKITSTIIQIKKNDSKDTYNITVNDIKEESRNCKTLCEAINASGKALEEKKKDIENLYYTEYSGNNGLLNFNLSLNNQCDQACRPVDCHTDNGSCLQYKFGLKDSLQFDSNNLSCYTDIVPIENTDEKLYCLTTVELKPNVSITDGKIKAYSGQMYFDLSGTGSSLLNGNLKKECYSVKDISLASIIDKNKVSDYIDISFRNSKNSEEISVDEVEEQEEVDDEGISDDVSESESEVDTSNIIELKKNGNKYEFNDDIKFSMSEVWASYSGKIIDKNCNNGNCRQLGDGLVSALDSDGEEEYKFIVDFNAGEYHKKKESICVFESQRQILDDNSKLNLEFRIIDTNKPFVKHNGDMRNTMTNWCYVSDDETSCDHNNKLVKRVISDSTNSYNRKSEGVGDGPKYKIRLTPQLMKDIAREPIEEIKKMELKYDEFNLDCNETEGIKTCKSKLLNYLKEKNLLKVSN